MNLATSPDGKSPDDTVDDEIYACLDPANPVSFFLFAGAGSGKTRSLVQTVGRLRQAHGRKLWLRGQRLAVITYTNAACDEIKQRLEFDPLIAVSTIHSFAWSLIGGFNEDIKAWLRKNLTEELEELEEAQRKGREGTKASADRVRSIESKRERLNTLDQIRRFIYSPDGDNRERESLNHSEVIAITAAFLTEKPALQNILICKYPYLFIDESQDANRHLMDAFLTVQGKYPSRFCLGLFGDTMQRIYADGKVDLPASLPADWRQPAKYMNHRSPARVVQLINKIRSAVDRHAQTSRSDAHEGVVRLFIVPADTRDKFQAESAVARRMAEITGDMAWDGAEADTKTLTLEHHMAARRVGCLELFGPLYAVDRLRTGLLDGSLPGLHFFIHDVLPLVDAKQRNDAFAIAAIVRSRSPLLDRRHLKKAGEDQPAVLKQARDAVGALLSLWSDGSSPKLSAILRSIHNSGLFAVPESLRVLAAGGDTSASEGPAANDASEVDDEDQDEVIAAWEKSLDVPFTQLVSYAKYISGEAPFDTHQGVKGLEFPRVMVIVDDEEARGFLFSYDKLLGAKRKSDADLKNELMGKETSVDRTRRLFYVICSRARSSLAIVHYSSDPKSVTEHAVAEGWFGRDEIEIIERCYA